MQVETMPDDLKPLRNLRVFLCHSYDDKPIVRDMYHRLQADGFAPWLDEENLIPGQDWDLEISEAVRNSDVVIVCLSCSSATKRGYIQKEIRKALNVADEQPEGAIFIIPLRLEECDVPSRLQQWQWVNWFEETGYERLKRALLSRANELNVATPRVLDEVVELQELIAGVTYSPFRDGQSPLTGILPSPDQIMGDLILLKNIADYIRILSVNNGHEQIPSLAQQVGIKLVPTAWLSLSQMANEKELINLITLAKQRMNFPFVSVGSETLLRGDLNKNQLIAYILRVKQEISIPVTTSESYHIWLRHPELADAVDVIFATILPYFEKQSIETAASYVLGRYNELKAKYPHKRVVISETGWPLSAGIANERIGSIDQEGSDIHIHINKRHSSYTGSPEGNVVPNFDDQKKFVQDFLSMAFEQGIEFFLSQAFNEQWKDIAEGEYSIKWGIYDTLRLTPKAMQQKRKRL